MIERHLSTLGESPSVAQIQNEQNRDQQYLAIQVQKKSSDGKEVTTKEDDYMSDICPYAAFKISKPPYSENSCSGNIYSGAYSSVKSSFAFHHLNSDSYKLKPVNIHRSYFFLDSRVTFFLYYYLLIIISLFQYKDSEYTKVRRKSGKLRDPQTESQGIDSKF